MNALKNQYLFRPSSQPATPRAVSPSEPHVPFEHSPRPLNLLSLSSFKRPSSFSRMQSSPSPANVVQDVSYIESLSLKLSEAVTKALAQPSGPAPLCELLSGKRPIPQGRGHALGTLIVSELNVSQDNIHLHRAIVRSLQKPLSVLLTNLSAYLSPLLASPAIHVSSPTSALNPTQMHALAIAGFAAELLEKFDELTYDSRIHGLRPIREGLVSLVTRVVNHLVDSLRSELVQLVGALESPASASGLNCKSNSNTKSGMVYHPSIATLQSMMPLYVRFTTRCTVFADAQPILATFLISIIWRAMVALAHRPCQIPMAIMNCASPAVTPPVSPPPSRFAIKLPQSRPPSPQLPLVIASTAADARALCELLCQFPRPTGEREATRLAREAVDEAFNGLRALAELLGEVDVALSQPNPEFRLDHDTLDLSLLIALPVLLRGWSRGTDVSVAEMVGLSEEEYRKVCLSGFGRAEECEAVVVRRVLDTLWRDPRVNPALLAWMENESFAD
ncbi:hypothetical protein APHAL10511_000129 [Amanita phalloides]|nr:hypothetical protein APHAL10511_000129 [Amanita phalloides]